MSATVTEINVRSKLTVHGFIRDANKLLHPKVIPTEIVHECSSFYDSIPSNIQDLICKYPFMDQDDNKLQVRSIRYLEDERWEIYHKHSELNKYQSTVTSKNYCILSVECVDINSVQLEINEFIVAAMASQFELEILEIEDERMLDDVSPSKLVEYRFSPDSEWFLSNGTLESVEAYRKISFKYWKRHIEHPFNANTFRRYLQRGITTKLHDRVVFPMPENEISDWIYLDDYGKNVYRPREIYECRVWCCKQRCYVSVDIQLEGAPNDNEKENYWNNMLNNMKELRGHDYINDILKSKLW